MRVLAMIAPDVATHLAPSSTVEMVLAQRPWSRVGIESPQLHQFSSERGPQARLIGILGDRDSTPVSRPLRAQRCGACL